MVLSDNNLILLFWPTIPEQRREESISTTPCQSRAFSIFPISDHVPAASSYWSTCTLIHHTWLIRSTPITYLISSFAISSVSTGDNQSSCSQPSQSPGKTLCDPAKDLHNEGFAMRCMKMLVDEEAMDSPGKVYTAFWYQALHHCATLQMFQNKSSIYPSVILVIWDKADKISWL